MRKQHPKTNGKVKAGTQQEATELLQWLTGFLPGAIPASLEQAILDESGEVHALLWHRSELQKILETEPQALDERQREQLVELDQQIKTSALLLFGAEKGTLQRYRQGRYDHSHWWWYLDDMLQEEMMAGRHSGKAVRYESGSHRAAFLESR